jgi:hypothetical protein
VNFSYKTKWIVTSVACAFSGIVGNFIYIVERPEKWLVDADIFLYL